MKRPQIEQEKIIQSDQWLSPRVILIAFSAIGFVAFTWATFTLVTAEKMTKSLKAMIGLGGVVVLFFLVALLCFGLRRNLSEQIWDWLFLRPRHEKIILSLTILLALGSLLLLLLPSDRLEHYAVYHIQLKPLCLAGAIVSTIFLIISLAAFKLMRLAPLIEVLSTRQTTIKAGFGIFVIALTIWGVIKLSGWGVHSTEDFWFGAGTPVLFQQVVTGILLAILFAMFENRLIRFSENQKIMRVSLDTLVFLCIWIIVAILWCIQPTPSGFAAPRPMPPNYELYPFADASRFDLSSQFALIGQGLNNGQFYYRIFYSGYLFILHLLFGQDFERLMFAQAILFAVFPSLAYLLGKNLWNRSLGIAAATVVAFSGLNAMLAGAIADLAHPKQMLTDYPSAIAIAFFLALTTRWLRHPENNSALFWAGGLVGTFALIRTSVLGLLAPLFLAIWFFPPRTLRTRLVMSAFVITLVFASALPWSIWLSRPVTDLYSVKIVSVISERYFGKRRAVQVDNQQPQQQEQSRPQSANSVRPAAAQAVPQHFLHGLTTSTLVMPPSFLFFDLRTVIRGAFPYWDAQWDGDLDFPSSAMILINLGILSIGIAFAFRASGFAGVFPLITHFGYTAINSLGRTSGGRYSAPVDWIFLFYYVWGCLVLLNWVCSAMTARQAEQMEFSAVEVSDSQLTIKSSAMKAVPPFLTLSLISIVMIFVSNSIPRRYQTNSAELILQPSVREGYYQKIPGVDSAGLDEFFQMDRAGFWIGRALYPRYFLSTQGMGGVGGHYLSDGYPRLIFSFLTPQGPWTVIFPGAMPKVFPNGADVYVLGCVADKTTIEALAVTLLIEDNRLVYSAPDSVAFACPLHLKQQ